MPKEFDLEQFKQDMIDTASSINAETTAKAVTEALDKAERIKTEKAAKEKAAKELIETQNSAIKAQATEAAKSLITELEAKLNEKDGAFAEIVKGQKNQIIALKDEIAQVVASRNKPFSAVANAVKGINPADKETALEADILVMLGTIKKVGIFETNHGKAFETAQKAVNASSNIQVSSEGYETIFSTNLMRDIQAKLVVAPLFKEMAMNSAQITIPINPGRTNANWVAASAMGDNTDKARTGSEISVTLTERTLKTFKLAAKTYLTEETEEDAIISLVPILRSHLVDSHVAEMDRAFLIGSGAGEPKGLVPQSAGAGTTFITAAKADASVKVTALEIAAARRNLGLYGLDLKDISLVVSQDAYWDLILDPEWADVQQVAQANATKLVGEVGNIYGMPVIVSNEFEDKAVSKAYAVMVNTSNFVTTRQRGMTLRSDFDVELDRTVFVATQRVNLEPLIEASAGNGKGVVAITYAAA